MSDNNLKEFTDAELHEELARREASRTSDEVQARKEYNERVLKYLPEVIDLIPHSRQSCKLQTNSGFNSNTGVAYCARCALQEMLWDEYIPDTTEIRLEVHVAKLKPEEEDD